MRHSVELKAKRCIESISEGRGGRDYSISVHFCEEGACSKTGVVGGYAILVRVESFSSKERVGDSV